MTNINAIFDIDLDIDIYDSFTPDLKKIWQNIKKESHYSLFQTYSWNSHWVDNIGNKLYGVKLQIIVIKSKDVVYAVFPFCIRTFLGFKLLEWIGGVNSDYLGPILSDEWSSLDIPFNELFSCIINKINDYDVLHLVKQFSVVNNIQNPFVLKMDCKHYCNSYKTELDDNWQKYYNKKIKARLRGDSRKKRRRLDEAGEVKFVIANNNIEKSRIIDVMIKQKSQRYRETNNWDMFSTQEYKNFYSDLLKLNNDEFELHCSSLMVDNIIIATHVGFVYQKVFYYVMLANDRKDWGRFSPGRLLLEFLLKESIGNKINYFDFTVGDEEYKKKWCEVKTELYESISSNSIKGYLYILLNSINNRLNRLGYLKVYFRFIKEILRYK